MWDHHADSQSDTDVRAWQPAQSGYGQRSNVRGSDPAPTGSLPLTSPASPLGADDCPRSAASSETFPAPPEQVDTSFFASNTPASVPAPVMVQDLGESPQAPGPGRRAHREPRALRPTWRPRPRSVRPFHRASSTPQEPETRPARDPPGVWSRAEDALALTSSPRRRGWSRPGRADHKPRRVSRAEVSLASSSGRRARARLEREFPNPGNEPPSAQLSCPEQR
nr:uncharacterized protein DKFZp434B061-like [Rhipicephalus microplus]